MKQKGLEFLAILALSLALWASDAALSTRLGVLANPQLYDGLSYRLQARLGPVTQMVDSSETLPHIRQAVTKTSILTDAIPQLGWFAVHAPLWTVLIALSEYVAGYGDLQADSVRIWPILVLLSSAFFISRRFIGTINSWIMVFITSTLPIVSVSAKSASYERFISESVDFGWEWFLADLRPDIFLGVLLFSANISFWMFLKNPQMKSAAIISIFFGLAIITKPSVSPAVILILLHMIISAHVYVGINNRKYISYGLLALTIIIILTLPYIITGGIINTFKYVVNATIISGDLWGTTLGSRSLIDAVYSLNYTINIRLGYSFWVVLIVCMLTQFIRRDWNIIVSHFKDVSSIILVSLPGIILSLMFTGINASIGLSSILSIWFAMCLIILKNTEYNLSRIRHASRYILILSISYLVILHIGSWHAYYTWPEYGKSVSIINRFSEDRLRNDISKLLDDSHIVTSIEIWGLPLSLIPNTKVKPKVIVNTNLYSMLRSGMNPEEVANYIIKYCDVCSPIILLDVDDLNLSPHMSSRPVIWPYLEEISRHTKREDSPYIFVRAYPIAPTGLTSMESTSLGKYSPSLLLFIRNNGVDISELGFSDKHDGILPYGSGWSLPTVGDSGSFRIAKNGSKIIVSRSIYSRLIFDVEPSHTVINNVVQLSIVLPDGGIYYLGEVDTARRYVLDIPAKFSSAKEVIQLSLKNVYPSSFDQELSPEIRIMDIRWADYSDDDIGSIDIIDESARTNNVQEWSKERLYIGRGWYDFEQFNGENFRWAGDRATLEVANRSGEDRTVEIEMEIEPGPSLGSEEMDLIISTSGGQDFSSVRVSGRQNVRVKVEVPATPGNMQVSLETRGRGIPVPNDPRTLNFRVFSVRRVGS